MYLKSVFSCSEYFEDSKLVNSCLRIATDVQKNNSWTYLYCNYDNHDSKTKYKKFSYAANEMKQEIDNYIDQYRNGSNVQPICAFNITPTYSDLKEEEEINGGGSKIKKIYPKCKSLIIMEIRNGIYLWIIMKKKTRNSRNK